MMVATVPAGGIGGMCTVGAATFLARAIPRVYVCGPVTACVTDCESVAQRHGWSSDVCWAAPCRESRPQPCHPTRRWRGHPPMVGGVEWSLPSSLEADLSLATSLEADFPFAASLEGASDSARRCQSRSHGGNGPSAGQLFEPTFP